MKMLQKLGAIFFIIFAPWLAGPNVLFGQLANPPQMGTFFSMQNPNLPPFPMNPFPDVEVFDLGNGTFAFDDRNVDYAAMRAEAAIKTQELSANAENFENESGGGSMLMSSGGEPVLSISLTGDDGRRISYTTQPGFIYTIEESTNLVNWTVQDTVVADDTNEAFYAFGNDARFYRVLQGSDLVQFPDFFPVVHQSAFIDVYTPLQGTANIKIIRDGILWYEVEGGIPSTGLFRVSDGLYNPANWPYDGLYNATNWEFRVTIISTNTGFTPAATQTNQGIVFKKGKIRQPIRTGIAVYQRAALPPNLLAVAEEEFENYILDYFLANLQASFQVDLDGAQLNEFIARTQVPAIYDAADRNRLRDILFAGLTNNALARVDRLHYFGHGTNTSFGGGIRISEVRSNINCFNAFAYVALDGCRTAQTTDMLGEFTCFWKPVDRMYCRDLGLTPGFGCGWKNTKTLSYFPSQGALLDNHFYFWVDFYGVDGGLTHRDLNGNGLLDKTYQEAYSFAKDPDGNGIDVGLISNPEATGFVMVGCLDCQWDL